MATFDYLLGQLRTNEFKRTHTAANNVALTPQNSNDYFTIGDTNGADDLITSLGQSIKAMFIGNDTTGITFFSQVAFSSASFLPLGGTYVAGHAGGTASAPTATPALSYLGAYMFLAHDDGFWAANSGSTYAIIPGLYGKNLTQPVSNAYDFQGWLGSLSYQHFTWTATTTGTLTAKINEGNNTMTTTIGSAAGTAVNVDGTSGMATLNFGLTMADAKNIVLGTTTGTIIGTSTLQKLGFYNATPVVQQGSDVNALVTYGLMSSISNVTFTKEVAATIKPADTVTAATAGAALSIVGGKGSPTTSGAGGALNLTAGGAQAGASAGGAVVITGGVAAGAATGGNVNIVGGAGFVGGSVKIDVGGGFAGASLKIGSVNATPVALGNFSPTAILHIKAGTTAASSAPLKFTTGTNMTTAEAGAMEYSSSVLYFTPSGTNRYAVLLSTIPDAQDITLGSTTGTKLGTATSQKLGFWNAAPIVQPTTGVAAATFVANTSGIANDTATWDGYTIGQVVKALRNIGILA